MTSEPTLSNKEPQKSISIHNSSSDAVYGIGIFGAWVYYFQRATTSQERVQAFFKGLLWPAFLVYELFLFLEKK